MKTVKTICFLVATFLLFSCGNLKAPIYSGVKDLAISEVVNDSITVKAKLNFKNPNKVGGKLYLTDLHTMVNGIAIGKLKNQKVKVPAKSDFSVPLEIKLSKDQLFNSKKGLLGSLLTSLFTNRIEVKLDGQATFKKFLFKKEYPIKFTKKIKIKK
ncbi:LEA type 2 family protein [Wenyingzhuangia sp. IMCC45574]